MKLSVSSYSFAQQICAGKMTQLDCISAAADMGFDAIDFTDLAAPSHEECLSLAERMRERAERVGITVAAYTIGANLYADDPAAVDAEVARLCREVEVARRLGAPVMRHDVCRSLSKTGAGRSFDGMLPTLSEAIRRVSEYAAERGVRTCSENHGFIAQDSDRMERLFNAVAHDNYGLLIDIGNFLCVDEDPCRAVSRLAPYAIHVHAKDFVYSSPEEALLLTRGARPIAGAVIGEGVVPVAQCLSILKRAGYDGYVTVEYEGREDCLAGIARGRDYLRAAIDAL